MKNLVKNNDMAKILGMTPSAFAKGVRTGRFSFAEINEKKEKLFDTSKVIRQYEATKNIAETQNHAALMPAALRGGRPRKSETNKKAANKKENDTTKESDGAKDSENFLKAKLAKEELNARMLEIKYKTRVGELIEKSEVQKQGTELGTIMVGAIKSWASRLSPELAAMKDADEHDFHQRLLKETNLLIIEIRKRCGINE
jgi:hypothetical protein